MYNQFANSLSPNLRPNQTAAWTPGRVVSTQTTQAVTPKNAVAQITDLPLWMSALILFGAYKLIAK